jgi:hypothetical protein
MDELTHFPIRPKSGQNEIIVVGPWVVTKFRLRKRKQPFGFCWLRNVAKRCI